jgi:hypothetical protein
MTPERKMAALFAAEVPPARDIVFSVEVARRIARRRAWTRVAAMIPWAIAAAALLWGSQPVLAPLGADLGKALIPAMTILGTAAGVAIAGLWLARRFSPA